MNLLKSRKNIIILIAIVLLVIVAIYQQVTSSQDTLSLLQKVDPSVSSFEEIDGAFPTYELADKSGDFLSYAVISSASGYGGPIKMLTAINKEGKIVKAVLLENAETPSYLSRVLDSGYPVNLQGHAITEALESNKKIDAVSGATRTTEGILAAVEKGVAQVGQNQLGVAVPKVKNYTFQWEDGAIVLLLLVAVVAVIRKIKRLRIPLLIGSVIIIGFMAQSSFSLGNFTSIIMNKMPVITERPIWFVLVIGILFFTLIFGKNVYCGWVCPFGAVQEGIYKALNLTKNRLDQRITAIAGKSRWFFIWLAVMFALFFNNPGIASYEPFSPFFGGEAHTAQWILMVLIIVSSIVIFRFWCRCFCPVGAVLDFLAKIKRKTRKLFVKKPRAVMDNESGCASCSSCQSTCTKDKTAAPLSTFNKFIIVLIFIIDLLIMAALLQNTGLI